MFIVLYLLRNKNIKNRIYEFQDRREIGHFFHYEDNIFFFIYGRKTVL